MKERSPEFRAISQNRRDLEKHLAHHLGPIAETLRDNEVLSDDQCDMILETKKPRELVSDILLAVKTDPVRAFWKIIELMKNAAGNESFPNFIETKIEAKRKELYREMIDKCGCDDAQKYDVFISYGREKKTNDQVDEIAKILHREGYTVFVDRSSIKPGDIWSATLVGAIRNCRTFVAVLTKKYVRSTACHGELYEAEACEKPFYPVVLEENWKKEKGANPVIKILSERIQYIQLETQEEFKENLPKLVEAINAKLGKVKRQLDGPSDLPNKQDKFKKSEASGSGASTSSTAVGKGKVKRPLHEIEPSDDTPPYKKPRVVSRESEATDSGVVAGTSSFAADKGMSSLEYYKTETGVSDQLLDLEIDEKDFYMLGSYFETLGNLVEELDLDPAQRGDVKRIMQSDGVQAAVASALKQWRMRNPCQATYRNLVLILENMKKRNIAIPVCNYVLKGRYYV